MTAPGNTPRPVAATLAPTTGITVYGCTRNEATLFRELAPRYGVRPTISDAPVTPANARVALGNRCISVSHKSPIRNSTLSALAEVGVSYISTRSIGTNHIDLEYATSLGIAVEGVAYSPDSVADHTLMLMLMAVRHAKSVLSRAAAHDFRLPAVPGRELRDLTVGVVGAGRIGSAVVARLRGFGSRVLVYDRQREKLVDQVPLDHLVQRSDIVTLHAPLTTETHHLLDRRRIEQMQPGAFVVNTGRGALLDTDALLDALESGRLGGAALDVVEGEEDVFYSRLGSPALRNEPLLRLQALPNVVLTPHTAYYTDHALSDIVENTLTNCRDFETRNWHG